MSQATITGTSITFDDAIGSMSQNTTITGTTLIAFNNTIGSILSTTMTAPTITFGNTIQSIGSTTINGTNITFSNDIQSGTNFLTLNATGNISLQSIGQTGSVSSLLINAGTVFLSGNISTTGALDIQGTLEFSAPITLTSTTGNIFSTSQPTSISYTGIGNGTLTLSAQGTITIIPQITGANPVSIIFQNGTAFLSGINDGVGNLRATSLQSLTLDATATASKIIFINMPGGNTYTYNGGAHDLTINSIINPANSEPTFTINNVGNLTLSGTGGYGYPGGVYYFSNVFINTTSTAIRGRFAVGTANIATAIELIGPTTFFGGGGIQFNNTTIDSPGTAYPLTFSSPQPQILPAIGQTSPPSTIDLSGINGLLTLNNVKATTSILLPQQTTISGNTTLNAPIITFADSTIVIPNNYTLSLIGNVTVPANTSFNTLQTGSLSLNGSIKGSGTFAVDLSALTITSNLTLDFDQINLNDTPINAEGQALTIIEKSGFIYNNDISTIDNPLSAFTWQSNQSLSGKITNNIYANLIKLWTPSIVFGPGVLNSDTLQIIPTFVGIPPSQIGISIASSLYSFQILNNSINPEYFTATSFIIGDQNNRVPVQINGDIKNPNTRIIIYGNPIYIGLGAPSLLYITLYGPVLRDANFNHMWNIVQQNTRNYQTSSMGSLVSKASMPDDLPLDVVPLNLPYISQNNISPQELMKITEVEPELTVTPSLETTVTDQDDDDEDLEEDENNEEKSGASDGI